MDICTCCTLCEHHIDPHVQWLNNNFHIIELSLFIQQKYVQAYIHDNQNHYFYGAKLVWSPRVIVNNCDKVIANV